MPSAPIIDMQATFSGVTPGMVLFAVAGALTSTWFSRERNVEFSAGYCIGVLVSLTMALFMGLSGASIVPVLFPSVQAVSPQAWSYIFSATAHHIMALVGNVLDRDNIKGLVSALIERARGGSSSSSTDRQS